jgi:hypothetical protein
MQNEGGGDAAGQRMQQKRDRVTRMSEEAARSR